MSNQSTIELLREMKFSAMASEFVAQLEDPSSYRSLDFEERFSLLVDAEWNRRRNNKLSRLMKAAKFSAPSASIEEIEYHKDRKLNKAELNSAEVMLPLLSSHNADLLVLAGFLPIVPDFLVQTYNRRIVNIHPSLLPKYGGKGMWGHHVHEAVKAAGEKETGMTVHWVTPVCDGGEIIAQYRVALSPDNTVDDIAAKEHELEMKYFPSLIKQLLNDIR